MTAVQKILKDLKNGNTTDQIVECFETKKINNGYYKLWLTNGRYSYVTYENFEKIEPYICYKKREIKSAINTFTDNILMGISEYLNSMGDTDNHIKEYIGKGDNDMKITSEQIKKLREMYDVNLVCLNELAEYIEENGATDDGLTDVEGSFEQGWHNAMKFVFEVLGI